MSHEQFSRYDFDLSAAQADTDGKWIAFLEIGLRGGHDADTEIIFPKQRIGPDELFDTEQAALEEARRFARAHVSSGEF